ncbi:hypothetical protein CBL_01239 [Carabus blaptoides fortunei]
MDASTINTKHSLSITAPEANTQEDSVPGRGDVAYAARVDKNSQHLRNRIHALARSWNTRYSHRIWDKGGIVSTNVGVHFQELELWVNGSKQRESLVDNSRALAVEVYVRCVLSVIMLVQFHEALSQWLWAPAGVDVTGLCPDEVCLLRDYVHPVSCQILPVRPA